MTATGTSPRRSISSGSSARRWSSRLAHASPAGPPPTIATPTSMRSSSSSSSRLTNSRCESTGGRWAAGTTRPFDDEATGSAALSRLHGLGQLRDDLVEVAHDAEVGELEDRGVRVLVDRHDVLRALHADLVLDRARDAGREVELRRHGLARLADLGGIREPARVDDRPGRRHRAAEHAGELLELLEALRLAEPAAAGHEDLGVLDVDLGAALLAARDHGGAERMRSELPRDVLHGGVAGALGLLGLERVEAADDHADPRGVVHVGDLGVLQDRSLRDEPAPASACGLVTASLVDADVGDLHAHARVEPRAQARADLEPEQAAAEQRVVVAALADHLRHRVDDGLREPLGALDPEDLRRAVRAERGAQVVREAGALAEHERVALRAELPRQARALGDRSERVVVEGAVVVQRVD